MIVVVIVVVLLVVSILAVELAPTPSTSYPVQIQFINFWAPNNVCGMNNNQTSYYGYNDTTNDTQTIDFVGLINYNATTCTIRGVTTNTTGFVISEAQVPLVIPGNDQNASMNITITTPGSAFSGNLNLIVS